MRRRDDGLSGPMFTEGFLTVARVGDTGSYSFHSLGSEPAAILTRTQTLALCAWLLTDAARSGAITLGEAT